MNRAVLVEGVVALTGPAGEMRIFGQGTHVVLDASGVRWAAVVGAGLSRRGRSGLRSVARALESHHLRVDVGKGGHILFSMGSGCRGGLLSWLFGGAPVARRAIA